MFQLLAYSFRRTRIYIRNLSVRYGLLVIVMYVYCVRIKPISYHVLYPFPCCHRLIGGGDLCVVPSVLNWVNKPVTENETGIGIVLLVDIQRGTSGTK